MSVDDIRERVPDDVSRKTVRDCLNTTVDTSLLERYDITEVGHVQYFPPPGINP